MTRRPAIAALALACLMTACRLSDAEQATVERWLLCEDCLAGELDSVLAIDKRALIDTLDSALRGPPQDRVENVRKQATAAYAGILRFAPAPPSPLPVTQAEYVSHFVNSYRATYQTRAVVALDSIGTPRAQAVLRAALSRDSLYAPVVRRALGEALNVQLTRFSGDSQVAPTGSLVAIPPTVAVRESTPAAPGAPLAGARVVFTVASGNGQVIDSIRTTDAQGRAHPGSWRLGPSVGGNTLRAIAAGQAIVFRAFGVYVSVAVVSIAPAAANLTLGDTLRLVATISDSAGNVLTGRVVTWASSNPGVAVVSAGLVSALNSGTASITATSEGRVDTTAITVP